MEAKEARKLSKDNSIDDISIRLKNALNAVQNSALRGMTYCDRTFPDFDLKLTDDLVALGYTVEQATAENYITIRW